LRIGLSIKLFQGFNLKFAPGTRDRGGNTPEKEPCTFEGITIVIMLTGKPGKKRVYLQLLIRENTSAQLPRPPPAGNC